MPTWTAEELGRFLSSVSDDRLYAAFVLLATTGMRRGEVLGLRWADVDLRAGHLSVKQTITASNHRLIIGPTTSRCTPTGSPATSSGWRASST